MCFYSSFWLILFFIATFLLSDFTFVRVFTNHLRHILFIKYPSPSTLKQKKYSLVASGHLYSYARVLNMKE
jgi:hypothetical protein